MGAATPLTAYAPRDSERYRRHERGVRFSAGLPAGVYVYVQDCAGVVWVCPDGPHRHLRVLGGARPAVAAGEMTIGENGEVLSINNLSGTFQCAPDSLLVAVGGVIAQGGRCSAEAITRYEV
jgi:hypothetical protein